MEGGVKASNERCNTALDCLARRVNGSMAGATQARQVDLIHEAEFLLEAECNAVPRDQLLRSRVDYQTTLTFAGPRQPPSFGSIQHKICTVR